VATAAEPAIDLLISGGTLYDGGSGSGRQADVGLTGDRIVFVGDATVAGIQARETLDATGLAVSPGFIDPHTHSLGDLTSDDPVRRQALNHLTQGVTTIFVGNDGDGQVDAPARLRAAAQTGIGVNVATFVGFGAVREAVIGEAARAPSEDEVVRMSQLVAHAMCEGALGLSAGLYYAPQSFSKTDEVIALARESAARGGLYETHLRDESSDNVGLLAAVKEALEIRREVGLPVHFAHIKAQGVDVHGFAPRVIDLIEAARAAGNRATADQYPWAASGTHVTNALIPRWTQDGGKAAMRRRLSDPALGERLDAEIADNIRRRGGPESLLITGGEHKGETLGQVAAAWGVRPADAARRIALEGDARLASFNMRDDDIRAFMQRPWVVTSSDATQGHPRRYGTFPQKFDQFVRGERLLTIEEFVHRSSGLTAEIFGIEGRGFVREGYAADVIVFDPTRLAARADYVSPEVYSVGVVAVIVNGKLSIASETPNPVRAGRALFHRPTAGSCP
jgi:N-acyl-D-amino-acid deacylase